MIYGNLFKLKRQRIINFEKLTRSPTFKTVVSPGNRHCHLILIHILQPTETVLATIWGQQHGSTFQEGVKT